MDAGAGRLQPLGFRSGGLLAGRREKPQGLRDVVLVEELRRGQVHALVAAATGVRLQADPLPVVLLDDHGVQTSARTVTRGPLEGDLRGVDAVEDVGGVLGPRTTVVLALTLGDSEQRANDELHDLAPVQVV